MNKYLVIYNVEGEITEPQIETATEIFNHMEFFDCYDIQIARLILIKGTGLHYCRFRNVWHDTNEPLKVQIENVVTGEVYDVGYQPEH